MYFPLSEVFTSQTEPAFCGISTLCMILNCLSVDPAQIHGVRGIWKGPWRWYHEELLDCCAPLEEAKMHGVTMEQLDCLAQCNGLKTCVTSMADCDIVAFRRILQGLCSQKDPPATYMVVNYDRRFLGQTGSGHFSPIAAYEVTRDMVLILDVARFKYPPHWVRLQDLVAAMDSADSATGRSRGYITLSRRDLFIESSIFTIGGTVKLEPQVWDSMHKWILSGLSPISDDLKSFMEAFRSNYESERALLLFNHVCRSATFASYPWSTAHSAVWTDISNTALLDRLSWTLIMLALKWCKIIDKPDSTLDKPTGANCCKSTKCKSFQEPIGYDDIPPEILLEIDCSSPGDLEEPSSSLQAAPENLVTSSAAVVSGEQVGTCCSMKEKIKEEECRVIALELVALTTKILVIMGSFNFLPST